MRFFRAFILFILSFPGYTSVCFSQTTVDIKVKKPSPITREFYYHDKPLSPEALVDLFPPLGEGRAEDTVDLRTHFFCQGDSSTWGLFDAKDYQKARSYTCYLEPNYYARRYGYDSTTASFMHGFINYQVLGNTSGNKFIILAALNGGGTLTQGCIFILDIKGDDLIRLKTIETPNIRDNKIGIEGNIITYGKEKYAVPASAR